MVEVLESVVMSLPRLQFLRKRLVAQPAAVLAVLLTFTFVAAACGSSSSDEAQTSDGVQGTTPPTVDDGDTQTGNVPTADDDVADDDASGGAGDDASAAVKVSSEDIISRFDADGDGVVTIGVAAAGPANDGAYYQAVVDAAVSISSEHGFSDPIVVDEISAADAATALGDLAAQADIIIVGAAEIAEPLVDLTEQWPDVFWYCNCGAGFHELPGLAQSTDDGSEIAFTAGVATALLLEETGKFEAVFLGCCDLGFEKEFFLAFQLGLQETNEAMAVTYVPTGDFPYDFDNVANATEALNNAVASGKGAVVPYLGGAHRPIVEAANQAGLITMSAGSSSVCGEDEPLSYNIAVGFDGGDYIRAIFPLILSGAMVEGETKQFKVGIDPEPGAVLCDANDEQQLALDSAYGQIAAGDYAEAFGAIKGEAYAG